LDSSHAAQDLNSLAGKILRLNDDGTSQAAQYAVL